jgi:hypothetical protein
VHHRQPHALPLIPGIDCDGAECSDGASFDRCPTADDVANKVTVTIGHEGQLRDDIVCLDQGIEERDLGRYLVGGVNSSERLRMYLAHPVRVGGLASSNQHVEMLTGDFERRYLGFRVLATLPRRSGVELDPALSLGSGCCLALDRQRCARDRCRSGRLADDLHPRSSRRRVRRHRRDEVGPKHLGHSFSFALTIFVPNQDFSHRAGGPTSLSLGILSRPQTKRRDARAFGNVR